MERKIFTPSDAFFPIVQRPVHIFNHYDDHSGFEEIPNRMAIVNDTNNAVLGIVSKNYVPVLNEEVYNLFIDTLSEYKIKDPIHHLDIDGRKWSCDFILDDPDTNYDIAGRGDIVSVAIRAFNAYNGKNTFGYEIFGFRSMCENGMIFGKQSLFVQAFRHFVGKSKKLLEHFRLHFGLFRENVELWQVWAKEEFNRQEFLEFLSHRDYLGERLEYELIGLFDNEYAKDGTCTIWDAYNLLTYVSTHKTQLKQNVSGIFGNKYRTVSHLVEDFYKDYQRAA